MMIPPKESITSSSGQPQLAAATNPEQARRLVAREPPWWVTMATIFAGAESGLGVDYPLQIGPAGIW